MSQKTSKIDASKVLSKVPFQSGFHFYTANGSYTGITATSLTEFAAKLKIVDANSVLFNYPRGDFQKWIQDTLGDSELANRMCLIKSNLSGEDLRKQLLKIIDKRIKELKNLLQRA
jgi:hypothetical protein